MKARASGVLFLLCLVTGISAQSTDKAVESINKRYAEISAKANACETDDDQGEYGELFMNTLTINSRSHQWRAVGIYGQTYKFFYKQVENIESRLYPDQLVFVKVERKASIRNYADEYLYSDTGALILYVQKAENDDQFPTGRRVYFAGVKAIRVVEDAKTRDRVTVNDMANVREINKQSQGVLDIFARSIKL